MIDLYYNEDTCNHRFSILQMFLFLYLHQSSDYQKCHSHLFLSLTHSDCRTRCIHTLLLLYLLQEQYQTCDILTPVLNQLIFKNKLSLKLCAE